MRYLVAVLLSALIILPLLFMDGCKKKEAPTTEAPPSTMTQPGEANAPAGGMNAPGGATMNTPGGQ